MDLVCDDQATIYGVVGELNTKNMKQKDNHLIVAHVLHAFPVNVYRSVKNFSRSMIAAN